MASFAQAAKQGRGAGKITGETLEIILLTQDITAIIRCKLPSQINL